MLIRNVEWFSFSFLDRSVGVVEQRWKISRAAYRQHAITCGMAPILKIHINVGTISQLFFFLGFPCLELCVYIFYSNSLVFIQENMFLFRLN